MNFFILLLLSFVFYGVAIRAQERRQLGDALSGLLMSTSKPAKVDMLTPKIRSTAKRARVLFGPYDFKPANNVRGPLKPIEVSTYLLDTGN
jgi:hypothetical protein